jgi:integrase
MTRFRVATTEQDKIADLIRSASPAALEAALRALRNGNSGNHGGKRKKKQSRFHGADHFLTREEFRKLVEASTPFYGLLWRLMLSHGLRVSEALGLRPENIQGGYLCVARLKHGEYTRQPLLVNLDERLKSGSYRIFDCCRSSAFLHFRTAAREIGIDRDRQHPHCLRHTLICWCLAAGVPVHVVSRMVGHRSINSTAQYMNCSDLTAAAAVAKVLGQDDGVHSAIIPPMVPPDAAAIAQVIGVL